MRALTVVADRQPRVADLPPPSPPGDREAMACFEPGQRRVVRLPAIDTELPIEDVAIAWKRMASRQVFGKIVVGL